MKFNEDNFIKGLKEKNTAALDYVVDKYSNLIFKVAFKVLKDKHKSEECVNDVLFKAWNSIESFEGDHERFKKWIMILGKYTAIDILRKNVKNCSDLPLDEKLIDDRSNIINNLEEKEKLKTIFKHLNNFKPKNKEIFVRRFFYNESVKSISKRLGITESATSNRILKSKNKILSILKEHECL